MPSVFIPGQRPVKKGLTKRKGHPSAIKLAQIKPDWAIVYINTNRQCAYNKASEIRLGKMKSWAVVGQFEADPPRPTPEGWVVWARCKRLNPEIRKELGLDADSDT